MKRIALFLILILSIKAFAFEAIEFGWASDTHVVIPNGTPRSNGNCGTVPDTARRYDSGVVSLSPCVGKVANMMDYFTNEASEFLILTGDNIFADVSSSQIEDDWTRLLNCIDEYSILTHFVFGNHCVASNVSGESHTLSGVLDHIGQQNRTEIDRVYYSFDSKGYHFVILDLDYTSDGNYFTESGDDAYVIADQASWLTADLAANKDKPTFIFGHQMAFSYTAETDWPRNTDGLVAILEKYGNVQAYFNGHAHNSNYKLQNGIRYYQTTGAVDGCKFVPLVDLTDDSSLTVTNEASTIVSVDWTGAFDTGHGLSSGDTFTIHGDSGLEGDYTATAGTTGAELHFDNGEEWAGSATPFDTEDYVENTSATANDYEAFTKINIDTDGNVTLTDPKDADNNGLWDMAFQIDMGKVKVTIDNTKVSGSDHLYNFPVLITEDDMPDSFWENVQADGSDIFVTSITGDGQWPRELIADSFDSSGKVMELWVKVPALQFDTDTEFLINYGGSGTFVNSTDVWSAGYAAVYHFNDDPSGGANSLVDSTSNAVHGDPAGTDSPDLVDGKVGKAWDFDATESDTASLGTNTELTDVIDGAPAITIEFWVELDGITNNQFIFWCPISASLTGLQINNFTSSRLRTGGRSDSGDAFESDDPDTDTVINTYHYHAGVLDFPNDLILIYRDGAGDNGAGDAAAFGSGTFTIDTTPTVPARISGNSAVANETDGEIDEFRISTVVRSAGWIETCFNNQDSPSTFYSAEVYVPVDTTGVPATGQLNGVLQ